MSRLVKICVISVMVFFICFSTLFILRFVNKKSFVNKMLQNKQIEKVEILDFAYFPFIIEEYNVKITLKNSNKLIFRNINETFCSRSILVSINDFCFDFSGPYDNKEIYSNGLPINLLQCIYGKEIKDIKSFLSAYKEICTCIYNIENGKIYYNYENSPFAFAGTAMGNKKFLEETNLLF